MPKNTNDTLAIAQTGVNITVDCNSKNTNDLLAIIQTVMRSSSTAKITLLHADMRTTNDLLAFARAGGDRLTLDNL